LGLWRLGLWDDHEVHQFARNDDRFLDLLPSDVLLGFTAIVVAMLIAIGID
jgi:hypothetical protein